MRTSTKFIECEFCGEKRELRSSYPDIKPGDGHSMIVLSIYSLQQQKRNYKDFCSVKCLRDWAAQYFNERQAAIQQQTKETQEQ